MPMLRWFGLESRDVLAADDDAAGGRLLEAGDHAQHRRLAAARRPEEGDELAALDVEVEVLHDGVVGEGLVDVVDAEEGHRPCSASAQFGRSRARREPRQELDQADMQPQVMAKAMMASAAGS